jgi:cation diffusion facilitator CzcD-associated flavoprotein CzcO
VPLEGKRVGVIGTGSTAIQITSALVDKVAHFELFQRTAQWVMPIENNFYTDRGQAGFPHPIPRASEFATKIKRKITDFFDRQCRDQFRLGRDEASIEKACLDNLENNVRDPVAARKAAAELSRRLQAHDLLDRTSTRPSSIPMPARDRGHHAHRSARRAHRRRRAA